MAKKIDIDYKKMDFDDWLAKGVLTAPKISILKHHAHNVIMVGSKGSGKTLIALLYGIYVMNNEKASVVGMRKWKNMASSNLSKYFLLASNHLLNYGIPMFPWKKSIANIQRENSKTNSLLNNEFSYHSLEESSSLDGNATNYLSVIIDEPLLATDYNRYYTEHEQAERMDSWDRTIRVIKDNCYRFNSKEQKSMAKTWMLMNPWDRSHPVMIEAEKISPENDYIKALFNGHELDYYLGNVENIEKDWDKLVECFKTHADYMVYDAETDTLVVRNNKFSNPTIDTIPVLKDIKRALIENRKQLLTIALGLSSENENKGDPLVFGPLSPIETDYKTAIINGWEPVKAVHSWDIDTSHTLTKTSGVLCRYKCYDFMGSEQYEYKIIITDIYEIKVHGSGVHGELNEVYVKLMNEHVEKYIIDNKLTSIDNVVLIDDKRKWFSFSWNKIKSEFIKSISLFEQHGAAGLIERQDVAEAGINKGVVEFTKSTLRIIDDMRKLVRKSPYDKKRETAGTINTLDLYDSFEQIPWYFQGFILNNIRKVKGGR